MRGILRLILLLFALLFLTSCAGLYFKTVPQPEGPLRFQTLGDLPYRELWSGFVFNGEKVGFTVLRIEPLKGDLFRITSEASLRFTFLGMGKSLWMRSVDTVRSDLTLVSFHYEQKMDDRTLVLDAEMKGKEFRMVQTGGVAKEFRKEVEGPLYPASIINLYPVLHGLKKGVAFHYTVFDPQLQDMAEVSQSVDSFEESPRLAIEPAFKVTTRMHHHEVQTWINLKGETIFELAMGGVLITHKEKEDRAKRYLSEASLSKKDLALDFSLIRVEEPIPCPRRATLLEIVLEGINDRLPLLKGHGQDFRQDIVDGRPVAFYRVQSEPGRPVVETEGPLQREENARYLLPSYHIESNHPEIRKAAMNAVGDATTPLERITRLVTWVSETVIDEVVENTSALDVLHHKKGECQAHTMLYTAMARSLGIPTRLAGGLAYVEDTGFLYHAWAESYAGAWVSVDPTFNQTGVDATHIKLVEGDSWSTVLKVGNVVGRLKARVIRFQSSCSEQNSLNHPSLRD